jgi:hypothetical protein
MIDTQPCTNTTIYTAILPNALEDLPEIDNGHKCTLHVPSSAFAYIHISILQ